LYVCIVEFNVPLVTVYVISETGALSSGVHLPFSNARASDIITPLTRVAFVYNCLTHAIVEVAKALGGSFKLVTLGPKTVRDMTPLPRKHKRMETHKQIKKHK